MDEERIPHSWIGTEVMLHNAPGDNHLGIRGTLRDVTAEGITLSYTVSGHNKTQEQIAFFPWSSFNRLVKL